MEALTKIQRENLRTIAGMIIPASSVYDVPGADDEIIQADIIATLGRDTDLVRKALDQLAVFAGAPLASLSASEREATAKTFRTQGGPTVAALTRVVLQCYYRDDRVLRSLGLETRPPYPKGHVVENGDWSLLDIVRARPPMWRNV